MADQDGGEKPAKDRDVETFAQRVAAIQERAQ